ncbi:hypothetical protein [Ensifer alkalisoli]|uniref:hypothetical protein n=1 Tax=Sinorhizobium alkalisoli TaxID=1752398 RepID=UPI0013F4EF40
MAAHVANQGRRLHGLEAEDRQALDALLEKLLVSFERNRAGQRIGPKIVPDSRKL